MDIYDRGIDSIWFSNSINGYGLYHDNVGDFKIRKYVDNSTLTTVFTVTRGLNNANKDKLITCGDSHSFEWIGNDPREKDADKNTHKYNQKGVWTLKLDSDCNILNSNSLKNALGVISVIGTFIISIY